MSAAASVVLLVPGQVGGAEQAVALARARLARLSFAPLGGAQAELEGDQSLAWALERSRPGEPGVRLARGEGGAIRWRVRFGGGGEAVVTPMGATWSLTRPLPTDPGPQLSSDQARAVAIAALPVLVDDPSSWRLFRLQTWREAGTIWYRARFLGGAGTLPAGWRREADVDVAGSSVVSLRRWVHPVGTDLGVVVGRTAELAMLQRPALLGIGLAVIGMLLAGAEALAFHERVAPLQGIGAALIVGGLGVLTDAPPPVLAAQALVTGLAVAFLPLWTSVPPTRLRRGPPIGALAALLMVLVPRLVIGSGGWLPLTRPLAESAQPWRLLGDSWMPALVEEPLLRGAVPGLTSPVLGWWGGALVGAGLGALLHAQPGVPLVASLGLELVRQLAMVVAARAGGVGAAVLARGTCDALLLRASYPPAPAFDYVALTGVIGGLALLGWPRRRS